MAQSLQVINADGTALDVKITGNSKKTYPPVPLLDGLSIMSTFSYRSTVPTTGQVAIGTLMPPVSLGDTLIEMKGSLSANNQALVFTSVNGDIDGILPSQVASYDLSPNNAIPIEYPGQQGGGSSYGFFANNGDGTTIVRISGTISGYKITNDLNREATRVLFCYGDSTYGPTVNADVVKDQFWMWQLRDFLGQHTSTEEVWRICKKAVGGQPSTGFDKLLKTGRLLASREDVILWGLGINDQAQSVSVATYIANFKNFYKRKRLDSPHALIIYAAPTPVQLTSRENALNVYRLALAAEIQNMITNTGSSNPLGRPDTMLASIDLSKAFDRTILSPTPYATSDGSGGDALHPGTVLAQTAIANKLYNGVNFDGSLTNFGGAPYRDGGIKQLVSAGIYSI